VLVEAPAERTGIVVGTACRYAPVELPGEVGLVGQFARVVARGVQAGVIQAGP